MRPATLVLVFALLFLAGEAHAHVPPMVGLQMEVKAETIECEVLIVDPLWEKWFGREYQALRDIDEAAQKAMAPELEEFMVAHAPVTIDGVAVRPTLQAVTMQERMEANDGLSYAKLEFTYGTKGSIRRLSTVWNRFDGIYSILDPEVPMLLKVDEYFDIMFTEKEPEYIWHAPIQAPLLVSRQPSGGFPVVSASILILLIVVFPMLRKRGSRPVATGILALALVSAFLTAGMTGGDVARLWSSVPGDQESGELFESLLENIYRAFDYDQEEAIYDSLAESVGPDLLESIYVEVYTSLIMKEHGGAVARVGAVKILDLTRDGETSDSFDMLCKWQVQGTVEHYSHKHLRTNVYDARFQVAWIDGAWRIASVDNLIQERSDE